MPGDLTQAPEAGRRVPRRRSRRTAESNRVEAFSDGVLAIVITLLVLDLKPPEERGQILEGLAEQWPVYVAYLASFAYVGVIWVNHHQLFSRVSKVDLGFLWRNLVLLLATSVLPFPTAVVGNAFQEGDLPDQRVALVFYSAAGAATVVGWLVLFHFLSRNPQLLHLPAHTHFFAGERRRAWIGIVAYTFVAVAAFAHPFAGLTVACLLPIFYAVTSDGMHWGRRAPHLDNPPDTTTPPADSRFVEQNGQQ